MLKRLLLSALLLAVPACAGTPAPEKPAPGPPKVMIIGDSISMGLGAMGPDVNCPLTAEYNSLEGSFGVRVANARHEGYTLFAWPGMGLVHNYGGDQTNTLSIRLRKPDLPRALKAAGPVDLILVNIGTHDFFRNDPTDAFVPAMEDLLALLSDDYPDATLYALTGPMLGGTDKALSDAAVQKAVAAVNAEKGTHIRYLALNGGDPSVALGCSWHPSIPAHEHMADMILEDLKAHE